MKKIIRKSMALVLVLAMAMTLVACKSKDDTSGNTTDGKTKDIVLTMWAANALIPDTEQKLAQEDWTISKIAAAFEAENPGVKVEITLVADQSASHQTFKAAANTDSCPDIVNLWSGQYIFNMKELFMDLTKVVPAEDAKQIFGWETTTVDYAQNGEIIGYPASGNEICGFIYNKKILAEAGLDFDTNPPKTLEEFTAACEKIAAAGYLPIMAADDNWNGSFYTSFANLWVQSSGSARIASDCTTATSFTDDKGLLDAYTYMSGLFKSGYMNEDYDTIANATELFQQGKAAMYATGNWNINPAIEALGEDNVGFYSFNGQPIGGPGQALCIYKNSPNADMALKFVSFLSNRENSITLLKAISKLPLRHDISAEDIGLSGANVHKQLLTQAANYVFWADNTMHPDVNAEMQSVGPLVITNKMTVEDMAKDLDQVAKEISN